LNLKDRTGFTAIVGLWYRPHERVELGVAGRVIPVFLNPEGPVTTDQEELTSDNLRASMKLTLPVQLRGGLRYIHPFKGRELFDIEANVFWENWSVIDEYRMKFTGEINAMSIEPLVIPKNWQDTVSVRLGGDVNVIPEYLSLRLGGLWESAAAPLEYSHLDFPSFMRGGMGAGITGGYRGVNLTVGYMHLFQESRTITDANSKVFQQRPSAPCPDRCGGLSGVPANSGKFTSKFDVLSLMIDIDFNTLFAGVGKNRKREAAG
jgi:long-subunit fatty acid transport protein